MLDRDIYRRHAYRMSGRNHSLSLALGAAVAGVSLGAFVAIQWMDGPTPASVATAEPAKVAATQNATPPQPQPVRAAETTGVGSADDPRSTPRCERQTWPYQSRDCLVRVPPRVRVIPTDKVDAATLNAIEGPATASAKSPSAASEDKPGVAAVAGATTAVATTGSIDSAKASSAAATSVGEQAATAPHPAAAIDPPEAAKQPASTESTERRDPGATKSKSKRSHIAKDRRKNEQREMQARQQQQETAAAEVRDEDEPRPAGHRWSRRGYDVPADDGLGRRRVYVIRRESGPLGGGIFGGLFGGRGGYDD